MEIKDLETFLAVAECKSFSRAAERLALGQPGVSHRVRRLEEGLGVALFARDAHSVTLTDAGQRLLPHARRALEALAAGDRAISGPKSDGAEFTFGAAPTIAGYRLAPLLAALLLAFPDVPVSVRVLRSHAVIKEVLAGRMDLGVVRGPVDQIALESHFLCRETMVVVWLAGLDLPPPLITYDSDSPFWRDQAEVLASHGVVQDGRLRADSLEVVKALALCGAGTALLPWPVVSAELAAGTLQRLTLPAELPGRSVVLIHRRNALRTPLLEAAIELAGRYVVGPS